MSATNYNGYVALACAIAKTRRQEYRKALKEYLRNPDSTVAMGKVAHWERKLKGTVTNLSSGDVETLKRAITQELLNSGELKPLEEWPNG